MSTKRARRHALKVVATTLFVSPWQVRAEAKPMCRAVIVAVTQYQGGFASEPTLVRALPLVEAALQEFARRGGYSDCQVAKHTDAALAGAKPARDRDILRGVADAARASVPGDAIFVYFTGHGTTAPDGRMFLHTSQADDVLPADRIDLREQLVRLISRLSSASVNMLFIDACRSAAGVGGLGAPNPLVSSVEALRSIEAQGIATLLAAGALETAWINKSTGYGYFTEELLAALKAPDLSNAQQLASIVRPRVAQRVKDAFPTMNRLQNPVLSVADSVGGPYVLRVAASGTAGTNLSPYQPLPVQVKSFLSTDGSPIRLTGPTVWEFPGQEVRLGGRIQTGGHALTIRALRLVGQDATLVALSGPAASGAVGTQGRQGRDGSGAGQAGEDGRSGGDGEHGEPGHVGGDLHFDVQEMTGSFVIDTSGQVGGAGGQGGAGGKGGNGAQGEASRPGVFDCASGPGFGGRGGDGGKGGDGGNGGNGGRAGSVRIEVRRTFNVTLAVSARGGAGGRPGGMGAIGAGGRGGSEGEARGLCSPSGRHGPAGSAGPGGRDGRPGEHGVDGQIIVETPAIAKTVAGEFSFTNAK